MCEQHPKSAGAQTEVTTIGIDLAKSVFAVSGADSRGRVVIRRQLRRAQVLGFLRGLPRCVVGMEATGGAQYWARQFNALGMRCG
jgi:transposase